MPQTDGKTVKRTNSATGKYIMLTAKEAKTLGFVDRLAYWPDVYNIFDEYQEKISRK